MRFSRFPSSGAAVALGRTVAAVLAVTVGLAAVPHAFADEKPVATVNGKPIFESDIKLAMGDLGRDLGQQLAQLPEPQRRLFLLKYITETQVFADAAEAQKLASGPDFDSRMQYWRRRTLRDVYWEKIVKGSVTEADAQKLYDDQIKTLVPEDEIKASHILIKDEAKAKEVAAKLAKGGDFAALAKEFSEDPGSKVKGGDLGYFPKGTMVPEFETAAFALEKGKISGLVHTQFGYHIIRLDDKRTTTPTPVPFADVKDRIMYSLMQKKVQSMGAELKAATKIEYLDPALKTEADQEQAEADKAKAPPPAADATPAPKK